RVVYVALNNRRGPLRDARVRRAINHAVNLPEILAMVYGGRGVLAHGAIPPGLAGSDTTRRGYGYDPAAARSLLAEAGYSEGIDVRLWRTGTNVELSRVAQAIQAQLAGVGVRVELVERDASSQREAARKGEADMVILDWWADYPDADNFLYPLFYSGSAGPGGNYAFYADPGTDSLILRARRTTNDTARTTLYRRIDERVYRAAPWLYLWFPPAQFGRYVWAVMHGDLGRSYITQRPIAQDLAARFPKTVQLALAAMALAALCGITLGVLSAIRPGEAVDHIAMLVSYVGVSFPVYWVGLLLILLFAVALRWLPPSGSGGLAYLVLPALTLGMRSIAFLARMTRAAMLDVLSSDFVRTARAKGLSEAAVILRHGFRNALIPVITVIGLDTGSYLTGSILTETIFGWPGLGRYVLSAIEKRDLPAIQGSILFMSLVFLLVNLVTDLVYAKADPRIAYD